MSNLGAMVDDFSQLPKGIEPEASADRGRGEPTPARMGTGVSARSDEGSSIASLPGALYDCLNDEAK